MSNPVYREKQWHWIWFIPFQSTSKGKSLLRCMYYCYNKHLCYLLFPMSILCSLILWINHYAVVQLSSYVCYFLFYVLNRRSSNQSFSSPDYKMKWFPHRTWRCYMLEQLHTISSAHLWNSLRACIWIHGWLVVITIGDQFRNSWKKLSQIRRIMTLLESVSCHSCDPNSYYPVCCYIYFKPKVHVVLQLATSGFSNSMQKNFFCEKSYCNYIGLLVVGISSLCSVLAWMCLLIHISILWIILMKLCWLICCNAELLDSW